MKRDLAILRCGWRAAYILDASRKVASGALPLEEIAVLPLKEAREALQTVKGVGPKVAECVLLYGMGRMEAFPMDVWMKRAMQVLFDGRPSTIFGEYAGIASNIFSIIAAPIPMKSKPGRRRFSIYGKIHNKVWIGIDKFLTLNLPIYWIVLYNKKSSAS